MGIVAKTIITEGKPAFKTSSFEDSYVVNKHKKRNTIIKLFIVQLSFHKQQKNENESFCVFWNRMKIVTVRVVFIIMYGRFLLFFLVAHL